MTEKWTSRTCGRHSGCQNRRQWCLQTHQDHRHDRTCRSHAPLHPGGVGGGGGGERPRGRSRSAKREARGGVRLPAGQFAGESSGSARVASSPALCCAAPGIAAVLLAARLGAPSDIAHRVARGDQRPAGGRSKLKKRASVSVLPPDNKLIPGFQ
jgi:hypothetical protein